MDHLFTWSGRHFGYRDGDNLWSHDGRHVGQFDGSQIYDQTGRYRGEIVNNHLITCPSKASWRRAEFSPFDSREKCDPFMDQDGLIMLDGYEDFPSAEEF